MSHGPVPPALSTAQPLDNDQGHTLFFQYADFEDSHFVYPTCMYKGYALIISNEEFCYEKVIGHNRRGSNYDRESLRDALLHLGFIPNNIRTEDNKSVKEIKEILAEVSRKDFTDYSCLIVAIFSYGEQDFKIYGTDERLAYKEIISPFNYQVAPSLFDKPKLFIVQSESVGASNFLTHDAIPSKLASRVITEPDVVFVYSHDDEDIAWKTGRKGTWFIQSLADVLKMDGKRLDVMSILTRVNYLVRQCYESYVTTNASQAICPSIHSLLSKKFNLF